MPFYLPTDRHGIININEARILVTNNIFLSKQFINK